MRLHVQHRNLRSLDTLDSWVEAEILNLGQTRLIDEAYVRLIRLPDASPSYQVHVHLVTPGPDVFAESRDHTLPAAFTKVMRQLHGQINGRAAKRRQRIQGNHNLRRVR